MVGGTTVAVGQSKLGVEAEGFVVVLDGALVLAQLVVGHATVVVGVGILGVEAEGFIIFSYGLFATPFLRWLYASIVMVSCCTTTP